MRFWIPFAVDALIAAIVGFFFLWGLADGTVSSFNAGLWVMILGALAAIIGGSWWLKSSGKPGAGAVLAWVLAVPGLLVGLFFLVLIVGNPRWN